MLGSHRATVLCWVAACLAASADAQSHARTALVPGQSVFLDVAGAAPGALVPFYLGVNGLGFGGCFPAPFQTTCAGIAPPFWVLAIATANASGEATLPFTMPASVPLVPVATQAFAWDVAGGRLTETNAIDGPIEPLSSFDDEFNGPTLSPHWRRHNPHLMTHVFSSGELRVRTTASGNGATWFHDDEGPALLRPIRGDFTVTAKFHVVDPNQPTQPPQPVCRLGGLMLRDPASVAGSRSWVYWMVGGGVSFWPIVFEDKSTVASQTLTAQGWPLPSAEAELRVVRRGAQITMFARRDPTGPFARFRTFDRPDLPAEVEVGVCLFSYDAPPGLEVRVDWIRFAP